jgi:hypothetical protein
MDTSINFSPADVNELGGLCEKYGSDKGSGTQAFSRQHNFTAYYHSLFTPIRNQRISFFEMGLGTNNTSILSNMGSHGKPGASLRAWRDYFPKAQIYGADIDKDILFNEHRITTFYCDQTSTSSLQEVIKEIPDMDVIIDDGLHTFNANISMLHSFIHKLKIGGVYIIEDVVGSNLQEYTEYIRNTLIKVYPHIGFSLLQIPHERNTNDNNLIVIQRNI